MRGPVASALTMSAYTSSLVSLSTRLTFMSLELTATGRKLNSTSVSAPATSTKESGVTWQTRGLMREQVK